MPDQTGETATSSPAAAETITIPLIPGASADLAASCDREGLSRADITNRAITLYEFVRSEMAAGGVLILRRPDGQDYEVKLT